MSPDHRFLTPDLFDTNLRPIDEENAKIRSVRDALSTGNPPFIGKADAPITITVFSDFQCPYCKQLSDILTIDLQWLPADARLVFRHFPLTQHTAARVAAEAAACAQQQGNELFWQAHTFLFGGESRWTDRDVTDAMASTLRPSHGFDTGSYGNCVARVDGKKIVDSDTALGEDVHVRVTPTLFIGTHKVEGVASIQQIQTIVNEVRRNQILR